MLMPTPIAAPPLLISRPAAVAASVVLAALIHAGALGMATELAAADAPIAAHPHTPPLRARVVLLTPTPQPATTRVRHATAVATLPPTNTPPWPLLTLAPRMPELATAGPPRDEPPAEAEPQQWRLYAFDEVDVAAAPESDWALDLATLDAAGIDRLVFELIVNERGEVIACTVLDPTRLDDAVRGDLERQIASTRLLPAERAGRFVASVRRIELRVEAIN